MSTLRDHARVGQSGWLKKLKMKGQYTLLHLQLNKLKDDNDYPKPHFRPNKKSINNTQSDLLLTPTDVCVPVATMINFKTKFFSAMQPISSAEIQRCNNNAIFANCTSQNFFTFGNTNRLEKEAERTSAVHLSKHFRQQNSKSTFNPADPSKLSA
jgi:hypothetical protein